MYLSIGGDMAVRECNILGIFDLDNTTYSSQTRTFLRRAEEHGETVSSTEELPKSFLLTAEFGLHRVYFSQFSPLTLEKRLIRGLQRNYTE